VRDALVACDLLKTRRRQLVHRGASW